MNLRYGPHTLFRTAAFCAAVLSLFLPSCKKEQTDMIPNFEDRSLVPGMHADSVTTLISDSGVIRYRIITAIWDIYDECSRPYWFFPEKVYFERFNNELKVESVVQCDTASYYYEDKVWKLERNVKVMNLSGEKFETHLLYWDQDAHRVYSDSFIRIEQQNQVVMGYGFESNEQLTRYRIFNIRGMFPLDPDTTEQVADFQFGDHQPLVVYRPGSEPSAVTATPAALPSLNPSSSMSAGSSSLSPNLTTKDPSQSSRALTPADTAALPKDSLRLNRRHLKRPRRQAKSE